MVEDKKLRDWSGTFQRLRAEAVAFAIVIFAFAHGQATLQQVLFIQFEKPLPRGVILLGLVVFWCFTAASWLVRFLRETAQDRDLLKDADAILTQAQTYEMVLKRWEPPIVDTTMPMAYLENAYKAAERVKEALKDITIMTPQDKEQLKGNVETLTVSAETSLSAISQKIDLFRELNKSFEDHVRSIAVNLPENISRYETGLANWTRETKSFTALFAWDRVWLGFWAPFGFSVIIVLTACPQIFVDLVNAFGVWGNCLNTRGLIGCLTHFAPAADLSVVPPDLVL